MPWAFTNTIIKPHWAESETENYVYLKFTSVSLSIYDWVAERQVRYLLGLGLLQVFLQCIPWDRSIAIDLPTEIYSHAVYLGAATMIISLFLPVNFLH